MGLGFTRVLFIAAGGAAILSSSAHAQRTGLEDMVGARAGQAEGELARRGFRNVRAEKGDDRSYAYWWNARRQQCVTIATMNGRYDTITSTPAPDCRQPAANVRPDRPGDRPNYTQLDATGLQRDCRMGASEAFDRRPGDIFVNAPIRQRDGFIVQGWYDRMKGKTTRFFNCRFDADGGLLTVR